VQHALRAFTPRDQKAVKSAATTLRANPKLDVEAVITELAIGEALVSMLDDKGRPAVVERAFVVPPGTRVGPITAPEREKLIAASALAGVYDKAVDRESAYEKLTQRVAEQAPAPKKTRAVNPEGGTTAREKPARGGSTAEDAATAPGKPERGGGFMDSLGDLLGGSTGPRGGRREGAIEAAAKSAARAIGSQVGREIVRGVLGAFLVARKDARVRSA
jgi:DNA helicase HerA-like ATPase